MNKLQTLKKGRNFLYIDGTNLLAGLIEIYGFKKVPRFKSVMEDFKKIYAFDLIYFYASYTPSTPQNLKDKKTKKQIQEELIFFNEAQKYPNVTFYKGYRSPTSKKEKGVDVHLAVDIVKDSFLKRFDKAIIVSGDADFAYSVEIAKKLGRKVYSLFIPTRFSFAIAYQSLSACVINYNGIFQKKYKLKNKIASLRIINIKKPRS